MRKMTLQQVGRKAMRDVKFWRQLRDDTNKTLAAIKLPPADEADLRRVLNSTVNVDFNKFMDGVHKGVPNQRESVWRPSWEGMWKGR